MAVIEDRWRIWDWSSRAIGSSGRRAAPYESVRVHGDLAYISDYGPFDGNRQLFSGRVGAELAVEQA